MSREKSYPLSELAHSAISKYLSLWSKILLIHNKKWRASWQVCKECGHVPECTSCSVPIARHKDIHGGDFGLCHICKEQYQLSTTCPSCHSVDSRIYGVGNQQLIQEIQHTRNITPLLLQSENINSLSKVKKATAAIASSQIMVSTGLLVTPPRGRSPDIVIVVSADTILSLPNYQAWWQNFCFLYELIQSYSAAKAIIVQGFNTDHMSIRMACMQDEVQMLAHHQQRMSEHLYPPQTQMATLIYKHEIEEKLHTVTSKLHKELLYLKELYEYSDLEVYATPPMVYRKFGKYRYYIVLKSQRLREFMEIAYSKLRIYQKWFKVDRMPESLL